MIKNEKQYKITRTQLNTLKSSLSLKPIAEDLNIHPLLRKAQIESIESQCRELENQIYLYESLKAGKFSQLELESFDLLPKGLIKSRIAKGLSQKELAERLGMKEQQIQKYESTEYATASFERLKQVINALGVKVREEIFLTNTSFTADQMYRNLAKVGISKDFVLEKLASEQLKNKLINFNKLTENEGKNILAKLGSYLSKIFGLTSEDIFGNNDLRLSTLNLTPVRYKKPISANNQKVTAYTIYAHMLALNLLQAVKIKTQKPVNEDPEVVRNEIIASYGKVNFENVLKYIWNLGIPVLALNDSGGFHGACWRIDGFNIIILKQKTMSESRWIYDALHELCHASQHPEQVTLEIIESGEILGKHAENEDEEEANYYAADVFLGENADDYAEEAILSAKGNLSNLKREVIKTAQKHKVDVGGLANYIAFRLAKEQGQNWWATANALQTLDFSPWSICRKQVLKNCNLDVLNEFNRDLLIRSII